MELGNLNSKTLLPSSDLISTSSLAPKATGFYQKRITQNDCLKDIVVRSNETTKAAIPAWIMREWANKFDMIFTN